MASAQDEFLNACTTYWRSMFELIGELEETTHRRWSVGTSYAAMEVLVERGFLEKRMVDSKKPERGGRPESQVRLTSSGLHQQLRNRAQQRILLGRLRHA